MATKYLLKCDQCGQTNGIESRHAGQDTDCEHCGSTILVPKLRELQKMPIADAPSTKPIPRDTAPAKKGLFVFALAVGVLAGAAAIGLYFYASPVVKPRDFLEKQLAALRAEEPYKTPAEVLDRYLLISQSNNRDIGDYQEPLWKSNDTQARVLMNIALGLGVLSVAGLLSALVVAIRKG